MTDDVAGDGLSSDEVLSCMEVFEHFAVAVGSQSIDRPLSEGAQTAFVNLYARLAATCPGQACERRADCLLLVNGRPKLFDGAEGKLRFLRMKARTEGRRGRSPRGSDLLRGGHARLVGDSQLFDRSRQDDIGSATAEALEVEHELTGRLDELLYRLTALDLGAVRGGRQVVAAAAAVAAGLVEMTAGEPLPQSSEERREVVRVLVREFWPGIEDATPFAVRKRQSRVREAMREIFERVDGGWLGEYWVPFEDSKSR